MLLKSECAIHSYLNCMQPQRIDLYVYIDLGVHTIAQIALSIETKCSYTCSVVVNVKQNYTNTLPLLPLHSVRMILKKYK